jgi:hypothetical protein
MYYIYLHYKALNTCKARTFWKTAIMRGLQAESFAEINQGQWHMLQAGWWLC